jgi:hypothetical protein
MLQNQGEEEIGHQGIFFIFFWEINKKRNFQKDITGLMKPSSGTKWCEPRDHGVTQPTRKLRGEIGSDPFRLVGR